MIKKIVSLALFIGISCFSYSQTDNYFRITFVKSFPNGQSNQVIYINFPDVTLWGNVEVTINGGYNWQLNTGQLTKRFAFIYNAGGYFNQKAEIPVAFGDLANQWSIGDYDLVNHRIPIYHLVATGNDITIQIEGLLQHSSCLSSIKSNLNVSDPVILPNSVQRQYMNIMQDRVGIGETNPLAQLHLADIYPSGGKNFIIGDDTYLTDVDVANTLGLYGNQNSDQAGLRLGSSGSLIFGVNSNILIGKNSQTDTGKKYKLDVEGPIRANEIVVNTTGADFVFEPTYKLRPLSELETFIRTNKHLPDIAPAKEMQENGVSAGEMQTKLLQKVEELTLYVIEQEKKYVKLQSQFDAQKEEIKQLKQLNK